MIRNDKSSIRKRVFGSIVGFFWCMLVMVGCGEQPSDSADAEQQTGIYTQWKDKGMVWKSPMTLGMAGFTGSYAETAYAGVFSDEPDFSYENKREIYDYWQNNQYTLVCYELVHGSRYQMVVSVGSVTEREVLDLNCLQELPAGDVLALDVVSEEDIALLYGVDAQETMQYLLIHLDKQGQMISQTDVTSGYSSQEIVTQDIQQNRWFCDEIGNSFVFADNGLRLLVFGTEGKLLFSEGYQAEEYEKVTEAFHAEDGSLILAVENATQSGTMLGWYDTRQKQIRVLTTLSGIGVGIRPFFLTGDGFIYYTASNNLWRWNIQDGSHQLLYSLMGGVIPNTMNEYAVHISFTEEENIILYVQKKDGLDYCLLSDKPQEEGIQLVDFIGEFYISGRVTAYNRENPEAKIQYEKMPNDGTEWTRTMAELAAGKGPDMICLFSTDERVDILYEKGILEDLTGVLPEDVEEQMFSGLLEAGTKDGKLIGICPEAMALCLFTATDTWADENWTQAEVLQLAESMEGLEGMFCDRGELSPETNLWLMSEFVHTSDWVDRQKNQSLFEREDFARVLELSKIYGEKPGCDEVEKWQKLREGAYLAVPEYLFSAYDFPELMKRCGDACHAVGMPGQEGYVGYWTSTYLILLNKNSPYLEECKAFVNYIMNEESQMKTYSFSAREDVVRSRNHQIGDVWYYSTESVEVGRGGYLFAKPDGSSYIDDFVSFLQKLGYPPTRTAIADIIEEEAGAYFGGSVDLKHTVEVIDRRVQLYLDEQK